MHWGSPHDIHGIIGNSHSGSMVVADGEVRVDGCFGIPIVGL